MDAGATFRAAPAGPGEAGKGCAICQTLIAEGEAVGACPSCAATYHEECWAENGGCAAYGCDRMPPTVKDAADAGGGAAPQSFWGQEEKACPNCGQVIRVAALRCRHCGAVFESARPMSRAEMRHRKREEPKKKALKNGAVILFIAGIIPCLAPFAAIAGGAWFLGNREDIRKLPGTYRVYCYAGLIAAVISTVLMVVVLVMVR